MTLLSVLLGRLLWFGGGRRCVIHKTFRCGQLNGSLMLRVLYLGVLLLLSFILSVKVLNAFFIANAVSASIIEWLWKRLLCIWLVTRSGVRCNALLLLI